MSFYEDRVFPHLLDWATRPLQRDRKELITQASGRVLELGVGTGANLPFYTDAATEIHGIEPAEALLDMAREQARRCAGPERFHLSVASAEDLPHDDASFDTIIACLVFCTIPDARAAAREMFRVLKPGGRVLMLEHVASPRRWTSRLQKGVNPVWQHLACGCQLTRDTAATFRQAGFDLSGARQYRHEKMPGLAGEILAGEALRP